MLRGHDVWILSAGVTLYALLAAVPSLLVAIRVTAAVAGRGRVDSLASAVGRALPAAQSPAPVIASFVDRAAGIGWPAVAFAVIPATVWGEGLRRGFGRVTPVSAGRASAPPGRWEGWRSRLAVLPVLLLSPLGLLAVLGVAPELARLFGSGNTARSALAFYIALNVDWVVLSLVLVYAYRALGPRRPAWGPLLCGSVLHRGVHLRVPARLRHLPRDTGQPRLTIRWLAQCRRRSRGDAVAMAVHRPGGPGLRHHPVPRAAMDPDVNTRLNCLEPERSTGMLSGGPTGD